MRARKNGEPAIPKLLWRSMATSHRQFADELTSLLAVSEIDGECPSARRLIALRDKHARLAEICAEHESETKPGRPPRRVLPQNALASMIKGNPDRPADVRRKPGRPTEFGPRHDLLTYTAVELRRSELAGKRPTKPTIKAAIDSLNEELARGLNKRVGSFTKDAYHRVRSAYQRGKRAAKCDQNPR